MIRQSSAARRPNRLTNRKAPPFSKQSIAHAARVMAPTFFALAISAVAHAQGTMDFSGAQTLMGTFNSRFAYVSISRAAQDAQLYTDSAASLAPSLSHAVTKSSALSTEQTMAGSLSM